MAAHGDIDHLVFLRHGHDGPGGGAGIAAEEEIDLIYGDGLFREGYGLAHIGLVVVDLEFHMPSQEPPFGVDFFRPVAHAPFDPQARFGKFTREGQRAADDDGFAGADGRCRDRQQQAAKYGDGHE